MTPTIRDHAGLEVLDAQTCHRLLAAMPMGRLAFVKDGEPVILPVNHAFVDGVVLFRTAPGSKLAAAAMRQPVAFEVDGISETYHGGWSVLVTGVLEELDGDQERTYEDVRLRPWARGGVARDHWLRLRPDQITGRRIRP